MQNWTEAEYAAKLATIGQNQTSAGAVPRQVPSTALPTGNRYRSKTEALYAQYLGMLKAAGQIEFWEYEPVTLVLARGTRYTPDFLVYGAGHPPPSWRYRCASCPHGCFSPCFIEVKGRKTHRTAKGREIAGPYLSSTTKSKDRIAWAAARHPYWRFKLVWPGARLGEWEEREITA